MSVLAEELLCASQISIQTIVMSNFGETLMTQGFEAILMLSKI